MAATFRASDLLPQTVTGLSAFLAGPEKGSSIWLNPQLSTGRLICKIGRISCWEAKGPAKDAFNEIAPRIKNYLDRSVDPITSWVTWSIYMLGKAEKSASPTILFCCEVAAHRKEVRRIIVESGLLDGYRGMKTGHMPRAPGFDQLVPLASAGTSASARQAEVPASSWNASHCSGMRISVGDSYATIGGVIQIRHKFYYTTAAHVFESRGSEMGTEDMTEDSDIEIEIDGFEGGEFEIDAEADGGPDVEMEGAPTLVRGRPQSVSCASRKLHHSLPPQPNLTLGAPFLTSLDEPGLRPGLDFALLEVTHPAHRRASDIAVPRRGSNGQGSRAPVASIAKPKEARRVFCTTSRGVLGGTLSGTPVYSRSPQSTEFQETLTATFESPLEVGDCGAWVVDAETGSLYGHIVAGSPAEGTSVKYHSTPFSRISSVGLVNNLVCQNQWSRSGHGISESASRRFFATRGSTLPPTCHRPGQAAQSPMFVIRLRTLLTSVEAPSRHRRQTIRPLGVSAPCSYCSVRHQPNTKTQVS